MLVLVTISCQMQEDSFKPSDSASSGAITTADSYVNSYSFSADGKTLTLTVDRSAEGVKAISHMNFKFTGCGDVALTVSDITAFTANGVDMMDFLGSTEGRGSDCFELLADPFVKLDQGFSASIVTLVITFDTAVSNGVFLIKASSANSPTGGGCFGLNDPNYSFSRECTPPPACYEEETAWAAGTRYVTRGNWATYTPYKAGSVNLYAGQNKFAGTATMSTVSPDNKVTITIALNEGWSLQEVSNPVKIQGYSIAPTGNPSPGRFASKGSSLTVTLAAANFYGIHLDVQEAVACPE